MSKDGGPAFPVTPLYNEHGRALAQASSGMTLRDYFAAFAMHAELTTCGVPGEAADALIATADAMGVEPAERMAQNAYEMADAMLKARES